MRTLQTLLTVLDGQPLATGALSPAGSGTALETVIDLIQQRDPFVLAQNPIAYPGLLDTPARTSAVAVGLDAIFIDDVDGNLQLQVPAYFLGPVGAPVGFAMYVENQADTPPTNGAPIPPATASLAAPPIVRFIGANFVSGNQVLANGAALASIAYESSTVMRFTTTTTITVPGFYNIQVRDPATGWISNSLPLQVVP